jgi:hypothetical protein
MNAEDITDTLQDAMDRGDFLVLFSANAGVSIDDVNNLQTVDLSPNDAPTPSPKKGTYSRGVQRHRNKNMFSCSPDFSIFISVSTCQSTPPLSLRLP